MQNSGLPEKKAKLNSGKEFLFCKLFDVCFTILCAFCLFLVHPCSSLLPVNHGLSQQPSGQPGPSLQLVHGFSVTILNIGLSLQEGDRCTRMGPSCSQEKVPEKFNNESNCLLVSPTRMNIHIWWFVWENRWYIWQCYAMQYCHEQNQESNLTEDVSGALWRRRGLEAMYVKKRRLGTGKECVSNLDFI